ncbi:MAG: GNAT family N-acetyltransferase [Pyrinomonadaceae bacterium]
MEKNIRRAELFEAETLTEIAHAAKRHWGYPERWIECWRETLTITPEFIRSNEVYLAEQGEATLGFYALIMQGEQAELEHMWVRPELIGTGLGRELMEHAKRMAVSRGVRVVNITADPNALGFYLRMGAQEVGQEAAPVDGNARVLPRLVLKI